MLGPSKKYPRATSVTAAIGQTRMAPQGQVTQLITPSTNAMVTYFQPTRELRTIGRRSGTSRTRYRQEAPRMNPPITSTT